MIARLIAEALGGSRQSSNGWFSCDCPVCKGEQKLGVKDTGAGLAVNCFKLCCRTDILAELERLGLLTSKPRGPEDPGKAAAQRAREEFDRRRRIAEARDFLTECLPWDTTTQIARYIRNRGIDPSLLPPTILWHGMADHPEGGQRPLMVGMVEHVDLGVIGVTRTFIATDGSQKAAFRKPRLFLGLASGGAVRLGDVNPKDELAVGEGIESTLSYMQLHSVPGWAALSAGGVKNLILPPEARRVVIAADNDASGVGWRGALAAARRWAFDHRQVRIDMPPIPGTDWNDVLISGGRAHAA
jgi:putative DNA primase/helicase